MVMQDVKNPDRSTRLKQAQDMVRRGEFNTAYRLYEDLLREDPGDGIILLDDGRAKFREHDDLEQATRLLLRAVEADPASLDALFWLAQVSQSGYGPGYQGAAELYRRSV